jgi:nucleoside-diphosphate-sugar epimerase
VKVLLAGASGRLGGLIVPALLVRGHAVRALVRSESDAEALRASGAEAVVGDLRGDVEWAADGCDAAVFAAGARHRPDLGAVDGGGAAKLAEAAYRYEHTRFVLCSVVGADHQERRDGGVGEFLAAKHHAERRLGALDFPWTILRFGRLTDDRGTGRITTTVDAGAPLTLTRDDAAITVAEALERSHLAHQAVSVVDGDRAVGSALDAVPPRPLPAAPVPAPGPESPIGAAQSDNPPDAPDMIEPDAAPLDADVDWEGDGPLPIP